MEIVKGKEMNSWYDFKKLDESPKVWSEALNDY